MILIALQLMLAQIISEKVAISLLKEMMFFEIVQVIQSLIILTPYVSSTETGSLMSRI